MARKAFAPEEIQRFQDLGLGRGIDATNPQPWANKSSFQVRSLRPDNIILTDEGGVMQSYEREISSVQTLQALLKCSVEVHQLPVAIGVEGEMSRSISNTRVAVGKKVVNRTISFRSDLQDVPLSHLCDHDLAKKSCVSTASMHRRKKKSSDNLELDFEEQFTEWILHRVQQHREQEKVAGKPVKENDSESSASIPETDYSQEPLAVLADIIQSGGENIASVVMRACVDFVQHFRITHYVCAIELGAAEYKVMTETEYRTEMDRAGTLGIDRLAAAIISGRMSLEEKSKSTDLRKIGSIRGDGQVEQGSSAEAVVGLKIIPVINLVRLRFLQLALQKAVLEFLEARNDRSDGPFIVSCDNDSLYLHVLPNSDVVATRVMKQASLFTIKCTDDGDHPCEFYLAYYGDKYKKKRSVFEADRKELEPIARYLEADVNILGKNSGPLKLKQNINHQASRFTLHGRLSTASTPTNIDDWVSGREIFYINRARREWTKDGYICVREIKPQDKDQDTCTYVTALASSIKSHDGNTCFMLFRLLPAEFHD